MFDNLLRALSHLTAAQTNTINADWNIYNIYKWNRKKAFDISGGNPGVLCQQPDNKKNTFPSVMKIVYNTVILA